MNAIVAVTWRKAEVDGDELLLSPLQWIVVYTVRDDAIDIVRILHGAPRGAG